MIGIDFGVINFATVCFYDYITRKAVYKTYDIMDARAKRAHLRIHNLSHVISLKCARNIERGLDHPTETNNIKKLLVKLQRAYKKLYAIRTENMYSFINEIFKMNPVSITIEDLSLKSMFEKKKNDHLRKYRNSLILTGIGKAQIKIKQKAYELSVPLHMADRYYPSTQICSNCGHRNRNMTLTSRTYKCKECGLMIDRDMNAARNLATTRAYTIHEYNA